MANQKPASTTKRMIIMVIVLLAVLGPIYWLLGVFMPGKMGEYFANMKPPAATVSDEVATVAQWQPFRSATGSVEAIYSIDVTTEIEGIVNQIAFESGQRVAVGNLLVQLDTAVDSAELKGLEASASLADANFERDKRLIASKSISSTDYETRLSALRTAEAAVESQKARIAKKTIRAPFAGLLGIREISPGEYLKPGTQITTLQALDKVFIAFSLPEQAFASVAKGQQVVAALPAYPGRTFTGTVTAIDARIQTETRNFTVQATFDNPNSELRPGMFAEVKLLTGAPREVVTVAETAVEEKLYGTSVFLISETDAADGQKQLTVERQYIEIGAKQAGRVEITSGLKPGDRVITAGQLKLQNGSVVVIDNSIKLN